MKDGKGINIVKKIKYVTLTEEVHVVFSSSKSLWGFSRKKKCTSKQSKFLPPEVGMLINETARLTLSFQACAYAQTNSGVCKTLASFTQVPWAQNFFSKDD